LPPTSASTSIAGRGSEAVDKKASRDITPEKQAKLRKLNAEQLDRVRKIFGA
jgi:hypothetical protein